MHSGLNPYLWIRSSSSVLALCTPVRDEFACCHGGLGRWIGLVFREEAALSHGHNYMGFSPSLGSLQALEECWLSQPTDPLPSGSAEAVSSQPKHFSAIVYSQYPTQVDHQMRYTALRAPEFMLIYLCLCDPCL